MRVQKTAPEPGKNSRMEGTTMALQNFVLDLIEGLLHDIMVPVIQTTAGKKNVNMVE